MAKGSTERIVQYNKDQSGCMWGLINIFDIRHGRDSQKLLADKKRGSRRIAGAAHPSDELNKPENSCEIYVDANAGEQCETSIMDKLSVKELMHEEMLKQHNNSDLDPKQTVPGQQGHGRKDSWHTKKKSFDLNDVHKISEKPMHRKHKSLSSLDVTGMMAELCSQIQVKDSDCLNHDQTTEDILTPPKEDPSVTEEKLGEAMKLFISHFVHGKNIKEGTIQPPRELMDALQVLNANKDMFLRLLRDPSSQLVEDIQKLEDCQVYVDENSKVRVGSDLNEQGKSKHRSFFWRRFKGMDRNLSKKNEHSEDVSTIIVLKPGSASSQISVTAALQSSQDIEVKDQNERESSHFFFTKLTRKLKLAMRKERPHLGNIDKAIGGESLGMASPSRDHFFIEKIPKSSASNNKGGKAGSSCGVTSTSEQQISDIYSEAKKHLAEIVGNTELDVDFLSKQVPKSLGRILSYTDYSCSPVCSPRKDGEHSLVTPGKESEIGDEITSQPVPEEHVNHAGSTNNESCIASEEIEDNLEVPKDEWSPLHSAADESHAEEIMSANDGKLEKQISLDALSEPCSPSTSRNEQVDETLKDSKEKQTMRLNLDVVEGNQTSSPVGSSPQCSRNEDFEDLDALTDRSERPSPISVLEPIFREDDVSPPSIKSLPVAKLIQPRQIKFEDRFYPAPCLSTWEEERSSVFELVKAVILASGLTQEQLLERFLFSEHLLDPSLLDEIDFLLDQHCYDPQLLFDLMDEVLSEVCGRDFDGIPSFYKPYARLKLKQKDIVNEIWEGVDWHLQSEHMQHTLDQTVAKDFSKSWTWMDLRLDSESIGIEMEEGILKELVEDAILSLISAEVPILQGEPTATESRPET